MPAFRANRRLLPGRQPLRIATCLCLLLHALAAAGTDAGMQPIGRFAIDVTEVTVGRFQRFADATGLVTRAERDMAVVYIGFRCVTDLR